MSSNASSSSQQQPQVRFFNTFEPVTSFYRDLLPELARSGFRCHVMISRAQYRSEQQPLHLSTAHRSIAYHRMPAIFAQASSRFAKVSSAALYVVFASLASLLGKRVDVNFFMTQPPLYSTWGWVLKIIRGQKYVCLLMDIYPDVAIESGLLRRNGWIGRATQAMVHASWRKADAVIVIGRCMAQRVMDAGVAPDRVHQIHNWSDETHVYPIAASENPMRQALKVEDKFIVLYSGNMGVSHTFDEVLQVARQLKEDPQILFLFVGRGSRRKEIENAIQSDQLANVRLLPFQAPERLAQSLSLADVHLVTLRQGFEGLVVPSKTYGALASGRPILYLGDPSGEIAKLVTDQKVGVAVPLGDPGLLCQEILAYRDDPDRRLREGKNACTASRDVFDRQSALTQYVQLLCDVVGHDGASQPLETESPMKQCVKPSPAP